MNKYDYNTKEMMFWAAETDKDEVMQDLGVTIDGLSDTDVKARRSKYGNNGVTRGKKESLAKHILRSFTDPFTLVLLTLAAVSLVTDVALQPVGQKNPSTAIIIAVMVFLSGSLRFV
ncbi:cation-transporting P-type ATPase [Granulicatella sp. s8]|uniref:Cation-transporting P-type ATPase n=1 Tax=Granulicatella seriolae TaxID=2967226 RepID=A0ABT1WNA6_9LACT|nr:cation-transporting P-type ATPase [Granulicatella seriolae]